MAASPRIQNAHLAPRLHSQTRRVRSIERPASTTGSQTQTETSSETNSRSPSAEPLVLRLRGAHDPSQLSETSARRRIQWAEEVVDNEGLGRKKSKVCCIYHKPRAVGESSSEDDSSSDNSADDTSGDEDNDRARMANNGSGDRKQGRRQRHCHEHSDCGDNPGLLDGKGDGSARSLSPNAYERMPKYHGKNKEDPGKGSNLA